MLPDDPRRIGILLGKPPLRFLDGRVDPLAIIRQQVEAVIA
jgi:hypothetical protein